MDFSPLIPWLLLVPLPDTLPPLDDLQPFPRPAYAAWGYTAAAAHAAYCERRWEAVRDGNDPAAEVFWRSRSIEASAATGVWWKLQIAVDVTISDVSRRQSLADLRERLGAEAYYRGAMPPPLPPWRIPFRPAWPRPAGE